MTIQTGTTDRKALAKALAAHLGTEAKYLGMPSCAYQAGAYTINRDGSITGEDFEAIRVFLNENGYAAEQPEEPETEEAADSGAVETAAEPETESEPLCPADPVTETHVTIPMAGYTAPALVNLLRTLYARQALIAAMTKDSLIRIDEELVTRLADEKPETVDAISEILKSEIDAGMVSGVEIEDGKLTMAFPFDESNPAAWTSYSGLMIAIADRAKEAKHAGAKRLDPDESEMKYFCRNWLLQLGMGGPEFKGQRQALLGHLHGFAAFRTADKMDAHKAKLAAKRKSHREIPVPEVTSHDPD